MKFSNKSWIDFQRNKILLTNIMVSVLIILLNFFFPFVFTTSSITPNTIKDNLFHTEWQCKTRDRHIYIATSSGILHFINVFTGKIDYSLDTGGDIFNSSSHDAYTFLPTIGNYFLTNIDPNKKIGSSNNGEIVISSTQDKSTFLIDENNGIMACTTCKNTIINHPNPEKSGIVPKVERADSTLQLNVDGSKLPPGSTKVERTDYSIILNDDHSKIFKYSFFNITASRSMQTLYPQEVRLLTTSDGNVKLIVNNSIKSNQKIIGVPVIVFGTDGLLKFSPHLSDLQINSFISSLPPISTVDTNKQVLTKIENNFKKHDIAQADPIIFVRKEKNTFSDPVTNFEKNDHLPQKMSSKESAKIIQQNFIKQTDSTTSSDVKFTFNAEIDLNKGKGQKFFSTRIKKRNENVNYAINYNYNKSNNKNWIALPIATFCVFSIAIAAIYIHLQNESKAKFIIVDTNCLPSGCMYNQKYLRNVNNDLVKHVESIAELNNNKDLFVFPLKIEKQPSESCRDYNYTNTYLITYPNYQNFQFDQKFDVINFLRRMLKAIGYLHRNGIVHSEITEEAFFYNQSENGNPMLGLIENNARYTACKSDFDSDITALKELIQRHINNACIYSSKADPLFDDLNGQTNSEKNSSKSYYNDLSSLSDDQILKDFLTNTFNSFDSSRFKSAADSILCTHPLFLTALERLRIFEDVHIILSSLPSSSPIVKEFEEGSNVIFGRTWARSIPKSFLVEASRQRRYNTSSLKDLVALIRNKWVHRLSTSQTCDMKMNQKNKNQTPSNKEKSISNPTKNNSNDLGIETVYGNGSPECYFGFFYSKFPRLFMYVYNFSKVQKLK